MNEHLESLEWSNTKRVQTKLGDRDLRTASPTPEFWSLWKTHKDELKSLGYSVTKTDSGEWQIAHWAKVELDKETLELSRAKDADIEVPVPDGIAYLGFQKAGIAFAKDKNALIADSMGLGKTVQAIGVINSRPEYRNVLVICPASIRLNWKREMSKWLVNEYTIGYVNKNDYPEDTDVLIINYDVVERHLDKINSRQWDLLIVDEAHYLKNPKAKRTVAILGKGKKIPGIQAGHKLFLTGTPILNRPVELFPLISAIDPDTWSSFWKYAHRYCGAVNDGYGWDFSGYSNLEELQQKLRSTIMIRRLKEEVLTELPPKRRQVIELPSNPEINKLLRQERTIWEGNKEVIEDLRLAVELAKVNGTKEEYNAAVKQLKNGHAAAFTDMSLIRQQIALAKLPYVVEHVRDIEGKVILFAHHKAVVAALKEVLGDEAVVLVGDTKLEDRQSAVDDFQNDDKIRYFIGSIQAAGVGITLTASSHVVFAELDWVPGNLSQAEDRAHRMGQLNSVLVQHLVMENSLDVYMAQTVIAKQEIIDTALDVEVAEVATIENDIRLPSFDKVEIEAEEEVSEEEKVELLTKLKTLASYDYDYAQERNNMGFSRFDVKLGHSLANQDYLTNKQAILARRITQKYHRQLE